MVLVGYGSNGNRLRVWEKVDWMVFHSNRKDLPQRLLPVMHSVIPVYTKRREIKKVSFSQAHWFLNAS